MKGTKDQIPGNWQLRSQQDGVGRILRRSSWRDGRVSQGEKFERADRGEAPTCILPGISTPRYSSTGFLHTWKKTCAQGYPLQHLLFICLFAALFYIFPLFLLCWESIYHWLTFPALFRIFNYFETGLPKIAWADLRLAVFLPHSPTLLRLQAVPLCPQWYHSYSIVLITNTCKQFRCSLVGDKLNKLWFPHPVSAPLQTSQGCRLLFCA